MRENELPPRWRTRVIEHARSLSAGKYESLGATAFSNQTVRLKFPDGSEANFRYAFVLEDRESEEIALFTEHCGYHVFPLVETVVEIIETQPSGG